MTKLKVVVTDEAAFYSALNPQESKTVIRHKPRAVSNKRHFKKGEVLDQRTGTRSRY